MSINFSSSLPPAAIPPTNAPSPTVVDNDEKILQLSYREIPFGADWNNVLPDGSSDTTLGCSSSYPHLIATAAVPILYAMPSRLPSPPPDTTRRLSASEKLNPPPGYRFEPSDVELIVEYLLKKVMDQPLPIDIIIEENIYKFSPWDLAARYKPPEPNHWYFFTPRDRKYPKGKRPNRGAGEGFWKATGAERKIYDEHKREVGKRNSLVFFRGKNPNSSRGDKTDPNNWFKTEWLMHEYVVENTTSTKRSTSSGMTLDKWVLSKIYKKVRKSDRDHSGEDVNAKEDFVNPEISQLDIIPHNRDDDAMVENKIQPLKLAASSEMVDPLSGFEDEDGDFIGALLNSDIYPEDMKYPEVQHSLQNFQSNGYFEGTNGYLDDMFTNTGVHQNREHSVKNR